MKLLLDTHVVLWWTEGDPRIPSAWVEAVVDPDNEVMVSAATVWEVEIKKRSGKLDFPQTVADVAADNGFALLEISADDAQRAGSYEWGHRDPFDCMLAAQAIERGLTLVTMDDVLRSAPGVRLL